MNLTKLLFILVFGTFSNVLVAQSGTLDPTFDDDGIVTTDYSNTPSTDAGNDAVIQPDGKIVVVGSSNNRFTVVRYNIDGSFDNTFNTYGVSFPFQGATGYAVTLQPDGKIIAAGSSSGGLHLVRLNTDGSLDTSFSTDGKRTVGNFNGTIFIKSVALASDGKILVAGYTGIPTRDFVVFKFNIDGSLDTAFDTDGIVASDIGTGNDMAHAMIIQPDNKILVAGQASIAGSTDFALVRYNVDGSLDTDFGGSGKITTPIGTGVDIIKAIDIQADGKIVVSGYTVNSTINYIAVARYETNGSLDTSFDSDGKVTFSAGISTRIKVLTDGKILINSTANDDYSVAKLNIDGSLDTSFGTNGYTTHNIGTDASNYMFVKSDDSIITGGTSDSRITIIQFSENGNLINSFQSPEIGFEDRYIETMAIQNDGKIVVAGESESILIARYNIDGTIDTSFGTNGLITTYIPTPNNVTDWITRLVLQNDGKIVIAKEGGYVLRYTTDGVLDSTFGSNGIADLTATTDYIDEIIISSTGKIYLAIDYVIPTKTQFGLVRLNLDGSIDTTFGNSGIAYTSFNFYAPNDIEFPNNLVELSNGKILVVGTLNVSAIGIVQFNSDGTLDTTFGTNGKVANPIANSNYSHDIVTQTDGKFIITHQTTPCTSVCNITVRYNSDGSIDTSYGTNGIVTDVISSDNLLLQTDGKIIKGGSYNNQFAITRYNIDGSTDTTFGTDGIISTTIGSSSGIGATALSPDGKLVAAGSSSNEFNSIFTLAKYTDLNLGNIDFTASNKSMFIYPNPIEEETNLTYKLTTATSVSIELFDMQGKLLKTYLQNASQNPDEYNQKIVFPSGLQSGNYLLKISSPDGSNSIKLMKK